MIDCSTSFFDQIEKENRMNGSSSYFENFDKDYWAKELNNWLIVHDNFLHYYKLQENLLCASLKSESEDMSIHIKLRVAESFKELSQLKDVFMSFSSKFHSLISEESLHNKSISEKITLSDNLKNAKTESLKMKNELIEQALHIEAQSYQIINLENKLKEFEIELEHYRKKKLSNLTETDNMLNYMTQIEECMDKKYKLNTPDTNYQSNNLIHKYTRREVFSDSKNLLANLPHIIMVRLLSIENVKLEYGILGSLPDIYVVANYLSKDQNSCKCVSSVKSEAIPQSNSNFTGNEELKVCTDGGDGILVLTLMTKQIITEDTCLGQIVLNFSDFSELIEENDRNVVLRLELKTLIHDVYNDIGERIILNNTCSSSQGFLNFSISIPNIYNASCGWFNLINNQNDEYYMEKVWTILYKSNLLFYEGPYGGEKALIKSINCKEIIRIANIFFDKIELIKDCIELSFNDQDSILLSYDDSSFSIKSFWKRALAHQIVY